MILEQKYGFKLVLRQSALMMLLYPVTIAYHLDDTGLSFHFKETGIEKYPWTLENMKEQTSTQFAQFDLIRIILWKDITQNVKWEQFFCEITM